MADPNQGEPGTRAGSHAFSLTGWPEDESVRLTLTRLDEVMLRAVRSPDPQLTSMSAELINRGGKRLRPALLILCARLGAVDESLLLRAAAGIELLHAASLYHDDIMDRATRRRGAPSVNALWGNMSAAAAGTHLIACAMTLLAALPGGLVSGVADATLAVSTGQLRETEHAFDVELTEVECLDIIAMKTATLFELPCQLGAYLAHADPRYTRALTRYGHHLGIAFQLTDDVLDISGHATTLGKPTGTDLREGVYALPVLTALRQAPGGQLAAILGQANPGPGDIDHAIALIRETDALSRVRRLAAQHAQRAASALTALPPTPTRTSLLALTDYAVARDR
jgi:geranylgeranyl pyrophosphate synthase